MSSQGTGAGGTSGTAVKARSRPTRQAAQQHKYADMKTENGFLGEEETPVRRRPWEVVVVSLCDI